MKFSSIIVLLGLGFCSAFSQALQLIDESTLPPGYVEILAREGNVSKTSTLKLKELGVKTKIPGKITSKKKYDDFWYYSIDIKAEIPVECYVFEEFDGAANSLVALVNETLKISAETYQKPLDSQFIFSIDTQLFEGTPYLSYEVLYTLGEGDAKISGTVKAASARTGETLQICIHNEMGYRESFVKIFEGFVAPFAARAYNDVFMRHVTAMTINDLPAGYAHEIYTVDADGDIQLQMESAMVMPVDASSLIRIDTTASEWSTKNGALINSQTVKVENGQLAALLNLSPDDNKWQVTGELQGKRVDMTLEHTDWLISSYGSYLATESLLNSDESSVVFTIWMADLDPSKAFDYSIKKSAKNPKQVVDIAVGPIQITSHVSAAGVPYDTKLVQGPVTVDMKQVFFEGSPRGFELENPVSEAQPQ